MKNPLLIVHHLCYAAAALLCGLGFLSQRLWVGLVFAIILGLSGCLPRRFRANWIANVRLAGFLLAAISGLFAGASPFLLIAGVIFALAGHETEALVVAIPESSVHASTKVFMKRNLSWVGIACLASLLICETALMIKMKMAFGVMVLIVVILLIANVQLIRLLRKSSEEKE